MKQKKKLLSDIEKLNLLNKLAKIHNVSKQNRTIYQKLSNSSSKKKNLKTVYLQKTNSSLFKPHYIRLIKKDIDVNSLSPNSFYNSNFEVNNNSNLNNSYDFIHQNKINKIYELKNSLGNPKYARNMMINSDFKSNKYLSISTIPNRSLDNKYKMRYLFNSNKKHIRNRSYNYFPINEINEQDVLLTNSNNGEINNINLDNLTYIEGLLNDILQKLYSNQNIFDINAKNECFQFLKYYKQSSLFNKFPLFFSSNKNQLVIKSAINLHLFIVLITYNLSSNQIMISKVIHLLNNIYYLLKTNLFLIIHQIESTNNEYNNDIHFQTCNIFLNQKGFNYFNEDDKINLINNNCVSIVNALKIILNLYQSMNIKHFFNLKNIYLNISRITEQDIYNYFYSSIAIDNDNNNNRYIIYQKEQEEDENFIEKIIFSYKLNKAIPPFLKHKCKKRFTIVLDLEDTLLNIKMTDTRKLILNLRPGLISFLSGIKPYYEIISFSKFSKSYSNTIINYIQQGRKLFDANLYREHCTLIGRKFVKDISRIGRDMKHIIMVDDLPENLEKFKANGILILPYEGEEQNKDRVLYELKKILILFCRLGFNDIRLAIQRYKDDIYEKITMGLNE